MDSQANNRRDLETLIERLRAAGVQFAEGMSDAEIALVEQKYQFHFPADLGKFLSIALPTSPPGPGWFANWRLAAAGDHDTEQRIADALDWPAQGICFDVERNGFWMEEWEPRPPKMDQATAVARQKINEAPRLIPIFSHRYIPAEPDSPGNPVFSVYQTDIIHCGANLASYLEAEFLGGKVPTELATLRPIRFWSRLVEVSGNTI